MQLDQKDKKLLELLQQNSRESLTIIAKALNLSIDSTHKRLKKLLNSGVIHLGVYPDPKKIGYELITNVQIKLNNINEEELNKFIFFLRVHPRIIELISVLGNYDLTCVIIAKNTEELEELSRSIRQKFRNIINDWNTVINLKIHKFEEYNFQEL